MFLDETEAFGGLTSPIASSWGRSEAPKRWARPISDYFKETQKPYLIFSIIRKNPFFRIIEVPVTADENGQSSPIKILKV